MRKKYNREFYKLQSVSSISSAEVVVPLIIDLVHPKSVVDVGCGVGTWLSVFQKAGCKVRGVDGPWVSKTDLRIPEHCFKASDLTKPLILSERFDLAMSVEVAEHLPKNAAKSFVESLSKLAPIVIFSAAIPGQKGRDHINCQWPEYWIGLFELFGLSCLDIIRPRIWNDLKVDVWYRSNMFLFVSQDKAKEMFSSYQPIGKNSLVSVVHPEWYSLYSDPEHVHPKFWLALAPYAIKNGFRLLFRKLSKRFR